MSEYELRKQAKDWLDILISLTEKYGNDAIAKELTYFGKATPQELMKDLGISEETAEKLIEVTKTMIEYFRL